MPEFIYVILSFGTFAADCRQEHSDHHQCRTIKNTCSTNRTGVQLLHRWLPTLGGIAIFLGFVLSVTIAGNGFVMPGLKYIIAAVIIMFFVGLKDDILNVSPWKKAGSAAGVSLHADCFGRYPFYQSSWIHGNSRDKLYRLVCCFPVL